MGPYMQAQERVEFGIARFSERCFVIAETRTPTPIVPAAWNIRYLQWELVAQWIHQAYLAPVSNINYLLSR